MTRHFWALLLPLSLPLLMLSLSSSSTNLGSSNICGSTFEFLPSHQEKLDNMNIPQGMQAMAKTDLDKERRTQKDIATYRLNPPRGQLSEKYISGYIYES